MLCLIAAFVDVAAHFEDIIKVSCNRILHRFVDWTPALRGEVL